MIRTARPQRTEPAERVERTLRCWGEQPECEAIAVEPADGRLFVFPKSHLLFAEYEGAAAVETVRLTFSSHEVTVSGHGLRAFAVAIQTGTVSWVKCFSSAFGPLLNSEAGYVTRLKVVRTDMPPDSETVHERLESDGILT